jgi:TFIIF-interacting CTD phosphatase-like protein
MSNESPYKKENKNTQKMRIHKNELFRFRCFLYSGRRFKKNLVLGTKSLSMFPTPSHTGPGLRILQSEM